MGREQEPTGKRTRKRKDPQPAEREPVRLAPTDDPAEAVERLVSRRQLIVEDGDVVIAREGASISRGASALSTLSGPSRSQYRLVVRGQHEDSRRVFATYERAVIDGEAIAAHRRVRLFYSEDSTFTLLKDYRPPAKS